MSLLTRTDVTAVKIYNQYILAGIGSNVEIFNRDSEKYMQKICTLRGQKIYGIVPSRCFSKLLVFGGKQFTVLTLNDASELEDNCDLLLRETEPLVCDDWIHSGIWLSNDKVALLSAHNIVQIWNSVTQTLEDQYINKENSILYSGLLLKLQDDILVFSGTVFSEVILHLCYAKKSIHYLKGHKGVIFSISCEPEKNIIVTTSDDRSVRVWTINSSNFNYKSKAYWENAKINCLYELYGHTARVMRSCIADDYIISIGEDSRICFWNYQGMLLRKLESHQNACLWSLDTDNKYLVTGGGDCGVILHPLTLVTEYSHKEIITDVLSPKKVDFTARKNIVIMTERNEIIYYNLNAKSSTVYELNHTSTYKLLSVSSCKQIIAVVDMNGKLDIFIENCKKDEISRVIDTTLTLGKILSLQWAGNRHLVLCSDNGNITILASKQNEFEVLQTFLLPPSKERWLTASGISVENKILAVSDRCGHIYIYGFGIKEPLKTFKKVHGKYGATSITIKHNEIITTGRDGSVKYFTYSNESTKYMMAKNLEFQWVEKFLDKEENFVCGFQERTFIVFDLKNNLKLIEVNCGGGHRSWDAVRYFDKVNGYYGEFIKLMYIKNSSLNVELFQLRKITSANIINGTHSKEINCLKTFKNISEIFFISGGEDTTLRISSSNSNVTFKEKANFKQLSSIRTLKTFSLDKNKVLLVSAGGRAQICAKIIIFQTDTNKIMCEEIIDYQIKGTDKERNRNWKNRSIDFDPETRIMDLEISKIDEFNFLINAACSDAVLRIFELKLDEKSMNMVQEIKYHKTCILKTNLFRISNRNVLVTTTTRGFVAFWEINTKIVEIPIFETKTNKSGINCIDIKVIDDNRFLLATGGDDNAIHLVLLQFNEFNSIEVIYSWSSDKFHCSQITGLKIIDNLMISTSIDERITLLKWSANIDIKCEFISQSYSDVPDIQGLDIIDTLSDSIVVCVFGKGVEVIKLSKPMQV
ncbi:unnamed protein product, partial [Brenthis ino]